MKRYLISTAIAAGLATPAVALEAADVLDTYADIAAADHSAAVAVRR